MPQPNCPCAFLYRFDRGRTFAFVAGRADDQKDVDGIGWPRTIHPVPGYRSGPDCLAANRIFVHRDIYDAFLDKYAKAISELHVGNGLDEGTEIGPLMHDRAVAKCAEHVEDARAKGARVLIGGTKMGGLFYATTLLADTEEEVINRANDSEYGLAAYVYTSNYDRAARVSNALEYGMVALNCVKITGAPVPFGGVKQSGLGREGSRHGLEEFTELKYVCAAFAPQA